MSTEKLRGVLKELESEAEALLTQHGIHPILSYAWQDHETPDTNHIGMYFWEMHAPYRPDFCWGGSTVAGEPPSEQQIRLYRNGEDLIGTMDFARRSIGRALCYLSVADPEDVMPDDTEFWHDYATALQWLHIASDRLKSFFDATVRPRQNARRQKKSKKNRKPSYSSGFAETAENVSDAQQKETLIRLAEVTQIIENAREERNAIVHEISTERHSKKLRLFSIGSNSASRWEGFKTDQPAQPPMKNSFRY